MKKYFLLLFLGKLDHANLLFFNTIRTHQNAQILSHLSDFMLLLPLLLIIKNIKHVVCFSIVYERLLSLKYFLFYKRNCFSYLSMTPFK